MLFLKGLEVVAMTPIECPPHDDVDDFMIVFELLIGLPAEGTGVIPLHD